MELINNSLIPVLLSAIATFLVSLYFFRVKNRIVRVQRKITITTIANSFEDELWGKIKVHHNDKEIAHLHLIKIEIINNTNTDIDDFVINLGCATNLKILSDQAINTDTQIPLEGTLLYKSQLEIENIEYLTRYREYQARTLNRESIIEINVLVESNSQEISPSEVGVSIEKRGIKLIPYKIVSINAIGNKVMLWGILFILLSAFVLYWLYPTSLIPIVLMGIAGGVNIYIGYFLYYLTNGIDQINE